jgi:hypothetical protein
MSLELSEKRGYFPGEYANPHLRSVASSRAGRQWWRLRLSKSVRLRRESREGMSRKRSDSGDSQNEDASLAGALIRANLGVSRRFPRSESPRMTRGLAAYAQAGAANAEPTPWGARSPDPSSGQNRQDSAREHVRKRVLSSAEIVQKDAR